MASKNLKSIEPTAAVEFAAQFLEFDPATGIFRWKSRQGVRANWNTRYAGKIAGRRDSEGYVDLEFCGYRCKAHQLAYAWSEGRWPSETIDHRSGVPDDNRPTNLRDASRRQNQQNLPARSRSGFKGVSLHKQSGLFRARIRIAGRQSCLGYFRDPEDAARSYDAAARAAFGRFSRVNFPAAEETSAIREAC